MSGPPDRPPVRSVFRAMGTEVEMLVDSGEGRDPSDALRAARDEVVRLEALLSRFSPDSEVSRLNRDREAVLPPDVLTVLLAGLDARATTAGRFDPTVGAAVAAAGYDRDRRRGPLDTSAPAGTPRPGGHAVAVDPRTGRVRLAPGAVLDLGGIAKGYAADRAATILAGAGPALVSVGGDIAVSGPRTGGRGWPVAVGDDGPVLAVAAGGIATSGVDRRRWTRGGRPMHHVIDPRTGAPAETDLLRVTACGPSALRAEVTATDLLLRGHRGALRRAATLGIAAVLVTRDGAVTPAGALSAPSREAAAA